MVLIQDTGLISSGFQVNVPDKQRYLVLLVQALPQHAGKAVDIAFH